MASSVVFVVLYFLILLGRIHGQRDLDGILDCRFLCYWAMMFVIRDGKFPLRLDRGNFATLRIDILEDTDTRKNREDKDMLFLHSATERVVGPLMQQRNLNEDFPLFRSPSQIVVSSENHQTSVTNLPV